MRITESVVRRARPRATKYEVACSSVRGLVLRVLPSGKRLYVARYTRNGRDTRQRLGSVDELSLDEARARVLEIVNGTAPQPEPRVSAEPDAPRRPCFSELAREYLRRHVNAGALRGATTTSRSCPGTKSWVTSPGAATRSTSSRRVNAWAWAGSAARALPASSAWPGARTPAPRCRRPARATTGALASTSSSTPASPSRCPPRCPSPPPRLCGGVTVFSALRQGAVGPGTRLGVVGLGGLGHLAVAFGRALGAEVTVLSSSARKREAALSLGASRFATDPAQLGDRPSLDLVLSTAPFDLPWPRYLAQLRPFGRLCFVGVPPSPLTLDIGALLDRQLGVFTSMIGSRATIREMLELAAREGIRAEIEVMPMAQLEAALDRVRRGQVRHRMVLEAAGAG